MNHLWCFFLDTVVYFAMIAILLEVLYECIFEFWYWAGFTHSWAGFEWVSGWFCLTDLAAPDSA